MASGDLSAVSARHARTPKVRLTFPRLAIVKILYEDLQLGRGSAKDDTERSWRYICLLGGYVIESRNRNALIDEVTKMAYFHAQIEFRLLLSVPRGGKIQNNIRSHANRYLGWQDLSWVHNVERVKDLLDPPHPLYADIILRISECASLH